MTVSFPRSESTLLADDQSAVNEPQKVLFVGQKVAAGTAIAGELIEKIGNSAEEDGLFGANSMLANLIRVAKRKNKATQFDAIALDDAGGAVSAAGIITFTGAPTETGTIIVNILDNTFNNTFKLDVLTTDTPTTLGDKLEAAINAVARLQVTAANVTGVVTLTADNGGTEGNFIPIDVVSAIAGLTVAVAAFTGGLTDPVLTGLFDVIEDIRYQTVVWPTGYDRAFVRDFLDLRFPTAVNFVLDGVAIQALAQTKTSAVVTANALNSQSLGLIINPPVARTLEKSFMIKVHPSELAALFGAVRAIRLTAGVNISEYTLGARGNLDRIGGVAIASLPYANTPFTGLPVIKSEDKLSLDDIDELRAAGVTTMTNNRAKTVILSDQAVTTYKTNALGDPDITFTFMNYVDTSVAIREFFLNSLTVENSKTRLTEGAVVAGRSMVNEAAVSAQLDNIYITLAGADFVLTAAGAEQLKAFRESKTITLDQAQGLVNIQMRVVIVTQFRKFVDFIKIAFNAEG